MNNHLFRWHSLQFALTPSNPNYPEPELNLCHQTLAQIQHSTQNQNRHSPQNQHTHSHSGSELFPVTRTHPSHLNHSSQQNSTLHSSPSTLWKGSPLSTLHSDPSNIKTPSVRTGPVLKHIHFRAPIAISQSHPQLGPSTSKWAQPSCLPSASGAQSSSFPA